MKEGYKFNEPVGYLPYYCKNCQILDNNYYFEMVHDCEKYIPEYNCNLCNSSLKSIVIHNELMSGGTWADNLKLFNVGDLVLHNNNGLIKIIDIENNVYKLRCKNCNKCSYKITETILWD